MYAIIFFAKGIKSFGVHLDVIALSQHCYLCMYQAFSWRPGESRLSFIRQATKNVPNLEHAERSVNWMVKAGFTSGKQTTRAACNQDTPSRYQLSTLAASICSSQIRILTS